MARRPLRAPVDNQEDDVNVTPLLDIVFIMLIFFIVTSTFIKEPGIDPLRPRTVTEEAQKPGILVGISDLNEVYINGQQVPMDEVTFQVRQLRRETPQGNAVVQADAESNAETLIEVIERIKDADVDDVAVSTEPA